VKNFIITGTSKGIGEKLAQLLLEEGYSVYGISRGASPLLSNYAKYNHFHFDLGNVLEIEGLMSDIAGRINSSSTRTEMICLVNNAAMLEPLKPIDQCSPEEINKNLQVSLIAPTVLTACFIRQFNDVSARRKIINISSGSGTYPAPGMSVYCTAKAGMNMFTRCVGEEQRKREHPVEIIAVDPGMVDTEMQAVAREKSEEQYEMANFFKQAHQSGQLQSTENLGKYLLILIHREVESGRLVTHSEG